MRGRHVEHLALAHEPAVGELPAAAVAVAAAVVGVQHGESRGHERLPQQVPLVGVVPGRAAVDDDDGGPVGLVRLHQDPGHLGEVVPAREPDRVAGDEGHVPEMLRQRVGERGDVAVVQLDAVEVGRGVGAAEHARQRGPVGREPGRVVVAGADAVLGHLTVAQVDVQEARSRPPTSTRKASAAPSGAHTGWWASTWWSSHAQRDRAGRELVDADRRAVARPAGERDAAALGRPRRAGRRRTRRSRRRQRDAPDSTSMTKTAVSWPRVPVVTASCVAVRRPARRALRVRVLGQVAERAAVRARLRRHHGDGVAGAVRDGHRELGAVRREVGVRQRREVRRVRQQVDQLPGGEVVAVDVVALRAAVVAGEVEVPAVGGELRAAAAVAQPADASRLAVRQVLEVDLPVAALVPLEGDGVAAGRQRVRPVVLSHRRRRGQLLDERRLHG